MKKDKELFDKYCQEVERLGAEIATEQNLTNERLETMSYEHNRLSNVGNDDIETMSNDDIMNHCISLEELHRCLVEMVHKHYHPSND